uniref:Reverse transcriptase domain-containing protein n=1 Tax=Tanacetum cinerariifolium TaxID=118510 RepID=A0A699I7V8_TANCI|nr:reverse transcriptase domain-containing protein [Tanacetum cinerariifolium]
MPTHSSSNLVGESSPNPTSSNTKRCNRRRSKQPFILEESPVDTMADQRTMAELLCAPTKGYTEAIMVPPFLAKQFELKHSLINIMTSDQFFGLEKDNPHDHIRWFNKITSTIKYKDVPNLKIKLILFPFPLAGAAHRWLEKEPPRSILTWEDLVSKFINEFFPPSRTTNLQNEISNFQQWFDESFHEAWDRYKDLLRACPHHGFTKLHQLDIFYNALNPADQDSLNSAVGGNLLERRTQDVLMIIENKSKVRNSRNKSIVSQVKSSDAISSAVTTAMTAILKQFQATPSPASVKADNIQGYVSVIAVNYNQGNFDYRPPGSGPLPNNTIANLKGELKAITTQSGFVLDGPSIPMPIPFLNLEEDERVEETLTDDLGEFTIKVPPPLVQKVKPPSQRNYVQKMLKALLSNKEKLLELVNTPLNENCAAVILKKLLEKLRDPRKFLILCGFSELKCKALADLGASINLMALSVWKKLGLPELISTRITFELANRAICTLTRIARDVFVPVEKFTFQADFVIVDYKSDPRVPHILGRNFLWTARSLIDVHEEEKILRDCDERLTLNMRHDTSSYSNQPKKESINMINIYDDSYEDYLEHLFATNHLSGNPSSYSHSNLNLPKVKDDIFDPKGDIVLIEKLLNLDSTKDLPPPHNINPLSGNITSSPNHLLEEFADELSLITFPQGNDDLLFDIESDLREIEYLLNHDPTKEMDSILEDSVNEGNLANPNVNLVDTIPEMFTDEHTLDYSSPPLYDEYDDDLFKLKPDNDDAYNDPYDSFLFEDFSEVDALPSTNNEEKDFDPPVSDHELPFHKEVPRSETLLSFSFENEEKVFKPGILTSKGIHTSLLPKLSHRGPKGFKVIKIFESPMEIFPCSYGEDIRILDVPCFQFYPP